MQWLRNTFSYQTRILLGYFILLAIFLTGYIWYTSSQSTNTDATNDTWSAPKEVAKASLSVKDMVVAINTYREVAGIAPLRETAELDALASAKCQDMIDQHYFSHINPQGQRGVDVAHNSLPNATLIDESIINWNFKSSQEVIDRWYNETGTSETGHRKAILNGQYKFTGLAFCTSKDGDPKDRSYEVVKYSTD